MRPQRGEGEADLLAFQQLLAHSMHAVRCEVLGQEQLDIAAKGVILLHIAHAHDTRRSVTTDEILDVSVRQDEAPHRSAHLRASDPFGVEPMINHDVRSR
jgi:hypothetical protein